MMKQKFQVLFNRLFIYTKKRVQVFNEAELIFQKQCSETTIKKKKFVFQKYSCRLICK